LNSSCDEEEISICLSYRSVIIQRRKTTLCVRDGKTLITDGPFAKTHEQLGGYFLLECNELDEALQWASKILTAKYGSIEIRPLWG